LPEKTVAAGSSQKRDTPDYHYLEPVITLIWMAHDNMGFSDDFVSYILTPEVLAEFIKDTPLWQVDNFADLIIQREKVLKVMNNQTRQIGFLSKNKLIYAFQQNIVSNKKFTKYVKWFQFAEKTRNKDNSKADFTEFEQLPIFQEVMKRINRSDLKGEDFQYIDDYEKFQKQFLQHEHSIRNAALEEGLEKGEQIGIQKQQLMSAEICLKDGMSVELTAKITQLPISIVHELAKKLGF
jgi:hypothetical protein